MADKSNGVEREVKGAVDTGRQALATVGRAATDAYRTVTSSDQWQRFKQGPGYNRSKVPKRKSSR
jgi:hypothetical protein